MKHLILFENFEESSEITITRVYADERRPFNHTDDPKYDVYYCKTINGEVFELDGTLKPYYTGRTTEYEFEPGECSDQDYFDENWEEIEKEILHKLYEN